MPPNALQLDNIVNKRENRKQPTSRPGTHVNVNISLADTPLGQVYRSEQPSGNAGVLGKRVREESPVDDDPIVVPIDELLAELNVKMPAAGFGAYKGALEKEQIQYCHQVLDLTQNELIELGIGRGTVKDLIRGAKKMLRVKKQQHREDKENVPIAAGGEAA